MANYTLTYSENSKGFPSFYSYFPEYMIGMNNYLYSFKNGQLYRHNTNNTRNNYYGVAYSSTIKTVINEAPLDNKLFKTLNLESTDAWSAEILTDVSAQDSTINSTSFEKKEGNYFAYVRTNGVDATGPTLTESDYKSRTIGGIGISTGVTPVINDVIIVLNGADINSQISVGDFIYSSPAAGGNASYVGQLKSVNLNTNTIIVDKSVGSGTAPTQGDFILYAKNSVAESLGVMGHYAEITLTLPSTVTTSSELFAIESELMKSYP